MLDRIPQVFISYSWTSEAFQQQVKELAEKLVHDGVQVKLDLWDLKDGYDKYAFMEQCVTNPEIDKVLIICDRGYAAKADKRQGGVGDETAVISAEVYGNAEQEKIERKTDSVCARQMRYSSGNVMPASAIMDWVKIEDIARLP